VTVSARPKATRQVVRMGLLPRRHRGDTVQGLKERIALAPTGTKVVAQLGVAAATPTKVHVNIRRGYG
jgi:hypothetical protein